MIYKCWVARKEGEGIVVSLPLPGKTSLLTEHPYIWNALLQITTNYPISEGRTLRTKKHELLHVSNLGIAWHQKLYHFDLSTILWCLYTKYSSISIVLKNPHRMVENPTLSSVRLKQKLEEQCDPTLDQGYI